MSTTLQTTLATLTALLFGYGLMQMGNTLQGTLLSVRAGLEGFSATTIGLIGAAFWAGVVTGSLQAGRLIRRVGHTRTFAALAAIASTAALLHLMIIHPVAWLLTRALTGFCFAGLFMTVESWLNAEATPSNRGRVLSIYGMVGLIAGIVGQLALTAVDADGFTAFCLIAAVIALALVPVSLSQATAPRNAVGEARIDIRHLYRGSPFGVVAAVLCGFTTASFFALSPVLLQSQGIGSASIAIFMASVTLGGFIMSWPLGRISDSVDRRTVAVGMAAIATIVVVAIAILLPGDANILLLSGCSLLFGACVMPTYGIVVAHVNDTVPSGDYVAAAGGLLVLQGIGSTIGPIASGAAMSAAGPWGLVLAMAAAQGLVVVWGVYRMARRRTPTGSDKGEFAIQPALPVGTALQPAFEEEARRRPNSQEDDTGLQHCTDIAKIMGEDAR